MPERHRTSGSLCAWALAALAALAGLPAAAQQVSPQIPGTVEPGRPAPAGPPLPRAPVELDWTVVLPGGAEVPESLAQEPIDFADLRVTGATIYGPEDFAEIYAADRGHRITFGRLYDYARAIQARYQRDGYILSFAYLPPQRVSDGVYTVAVVEGFVSDIAVEGVEGLLAETIAARLAPVAAERPLNIATLERAMLLANDLAGVTATAVLQPAKSTPGAAELVAKATLVPIDGSARLDNRGSEFEGPWRAAAGVGVNSPFGRGARVALDASVTPGDAKELRSLDLAYLQPLGADGLTAEASVGYTRSRPGYTLEPFDVVTSGLSAGLALRYPLIRRREDTLGLGAGFDYLDSDVDLLEAPFSRDRIRAVFATFDYSHIGWLGGATALRATARHGLDVLNASDPRSDAMSRADADPEFTRLEFSLAHSQPLPRGLVLTLWAEGQYSFDPLPAAEEFAAGGPRFGRAYDLAEITGEHGVAAALELGYDLRPDRDWPQSSWIAGVTPYVFYDIARSWQKETAQTDGSSDSLASTGLGLRLVLVGGAELDLEYAYPLARTPLSDTDKSGRVFAAFSARF